MALLRSRSTLALLLFGLGLTGMWAIVYAGPRPARLTGNRDEAGLEEPGRPADPEAARLQGRWRLLYLESEGKEADDAMFLTEREPIRRSRWTFQGNRVLLTAGTETLEGRFQVDSLRTPLRLDVTFSDRNRHIATLYGIWSVDGNVLQLCFARGGSHRVQRPAEFETQPGTGYFLVVLKREGGPEPEPSLPPPALKRGKIVPAKLTSRNSDVFHLRERHFSIPFAAAEPGRLKAVTLLASRDEGRSWRPVDSAEPAQREFRYRAREDGTYWFAVQAVAPDGAVSPERFEDLTPGLKVCVDTCPPDVRLRRGDGPPGTACVTWEIRDENLALSTLQLAYRPAGDEEAPWTSLPVRRAATGTHTWYPQTDGAVIVSLSVRDRAGNESTRRLILPAVR